VKLGTLFVAIAWIFAATASAANDPGLSERLLPLIDAHQGRVAVAVRHLENGASFEYRAAEPLPTASLIKLPVMPV
jgi:beta-lactamase class A